VSSSPGSVAMVVANPWEGWGQGWRRVAGKQLRSLPNTCSTGSPSLPTSPPPTKGSNFKPSPFQMGWFGSSTAEPTAVTRGGRQHCWDNRDTYFACLDNNRVLKPGDEGKVCATEKAAYEKSCVKSWVCSFLQTSLRNSRIQTGLLDRIL